MLLVPEIYLHVFSNLQNGLKLSLPWLVVNFSFYDIFDISSHRRLEDKLYRIIGTLLSACLSFLLINTKFLFCVLTTHLYLDVLTKSEEWYHILISHTYVVYHVSDYCLWLKYSLLCICMLCLR